MRCSTLDLCTGWWHHGPSDTGPAWLLHYTSYHHLWHQCKPFMLTFCSTMLWMNLRFPTIGNPTLRMINLWWWRKSSFPQISQSVVGIYRRFRERHVCRPLSGLWCKEESNKHTQSAHLYLPRGQLGSRACQPLHRFALFWLLRKHGYGVWIHYIERLSLLNIKWIFLDVIKFRSNGIKL